MFLLLINVWSLWWYIHIIYHLWYWWITVNIHCQQLLWPPVYYIHRKNSYVPLLLPSRHPISYHICSLTNIPFLVVYTSVRIIQQQCYPVQVNTYVSAYIGPSYQSNVSYYCVFLAKYPINTKKSDNTSWWWPYWYRYLHDSVSNSIILSEKILF